jgi:hypothetical protein
MMDLEDSVLVDVTADCAVQENDNKTKEHAKKNCFIIKNLKRHKNKLFIPS